MFKGIREELNELVIDAKMHPWLAVVAAILLVIAFANVPSLS